MNNKQPPEGLKEYLFALYYGQKIMISSQLTGVRDINYFNLSYVDDKHIDPQIALRPLSSITLEQAVTICQLFGWGDGVSFKIRQKLNPFGEKYAQVYFLDASSDEIIAGNFNEKGTFHSLNSYRGETYFAAHLQAIQFGYAAPIYYKGVQYSVEQLTEWGFIKLI